MPTYNIKTKSSNKFSYIYINSTLNTLHATECYGQESNYENITWQSYLQVYRAQNQAKFLLGIEECLAHLKVVWVVQRYLILNFVFTLRNAVSHSCRTSSNVVRWLVSNGLAILGKNVIRGNWINTDINTSIPNNLRIKRKTPTVWD